MPNMTSVDSELMLLFPLKDGQQDATECLVSINMVIMVSSGEACCFKLYTEFKSQNVLFLYKIY